jgi:hypothetical protein
MLRKDSHATVSFLKESLWLKVVFPRLDTTTDFRYVVVAQVKQGRARRNGGAPIPPATHYSLPQIRRHLYRLAEKTGEFAVFYRPAEIFGETAAYGAVGGQLGGGDVGTAKFIRTFICPFGGAGIVYYTIESHIKTLISIRCYPPNPCAG